MRSKRQGFGREILTIGLIIYLWSPCRVFMDLKVLGTQNQGTINLCYYSSYAPDSFA